MFFLQTPRLTLKPHTLADAEKLNAWENDPDLLYYNDDQPEDRTPEGLEETRLYLERITQNGGDGRLIHYAIHLKPGDELIGNGMIGFIDRYNRSCRLGITIGEKRYWGSGLGKEAMTAVITYCFETLGMNRIGAEVYAFNQRSIRLFESLGFRREGVIRQAVLKNGGFSDEYLFGLLKDEWLARIIR
jgi:RimJ/RimL family protein N-acetyltransferase